MELVRSFAVVACGLVVLVSSSPAQQRPVPARPRLPAAADTNSPIAYLRLGNELLDREPARAAAAFYRASRLDPQSSDAPYAYRVALLLADPYRLRDYLSGRERARRSDAVRQIDTLMAHALMLDPFLHASLDDHLFMHMVLSQLGRGMPPDAIRDPELQYEVRNWLASYPELRAYFAYCGGEFDNALAQWRDLARAYPRDPQIRVYRARAFFLTERYDSAAAEMTAALTTARARDADSTRFFYESKAAWEFSLGRIHYRQGDPQRARAAFERALVEDLSYYPAHVALAGLAAQSADTAGALREFGRAVATKEDAYLPRLSYGLYLAQTGRMDSAQVHLGRAAEFEPFAAYPRKILGVVRDRLGDGAGAIEAFEAYLERAPENDPDVARVRARVAQLRAARD